MSLWSSTDNANGVPLSVPAQFNLTPNTTNRDALYGNTTADAFITGKKVGVYGVDTAEIAVGSYYLSAAAANNVGTGGSYVPGEELSITSTGATSTTAATVTVATTKIRTATIVGAGSGYANGDTVTCNTGTMTTNAVFTVTTGAANTGIASLAITTNGVFTTNPTLTAGALKNLTVANSSANGATATVTMRINSLGIGNQGLYSVVPTEANNNTLANSATGTGATVALTWGQASGKGIAHTGWVVRTEGTGGRAGRVHYEVLIAGGISGDGSDDAVLPDA